MNNALDGKTFQQNQQRADDVVDQIKAAGRRAIAVQADSSGGGGRRG